MRGTYTFGPFTLDERAGELRHGKTRVPLEPRVFALLVFLVQHPQRLIERELLLDSLWTDTHVTDASLSQAIATLRTALDDDARDPHYIETVPRRGYRFIAAVTARAAPGLACRIVYGLREFILTPGAHIIGRAKDAAIRIESTEVSRHHARVTIAGDGATIEDLGSKNGTAVGEDRISGKHPLHDGDEIRLGSVGLTFHASGGTDLTATTPKA